MSVYGATVIDDRTTVAQLVHLLIDVEALADHVEDHVEAHGQAPSLGQLDDFIREQHPPRHRIAIYRTARGRLALGLDDPDDDEPGIVVGEQVQP